jgi:hypothetical protein
MFGHATFPSVQHRTTCFPPGLRARTLADVVAPGEEPADTECNRYYPLYRGRGVLSAHLYGLVVPVLLEGSLVMSNLSFCLCQSRKSFRPVPWTASCVPGVGRPPWWPAAPLGARRVVSRGRTTAVSPAKPSAETIPARQRLGLVLRPHPGRSDSRSPTAMTFAVGSSLYPHTINRTRGEHHDRYLHLRCLFQP